MKRPRFYTRKRNIVMHEMTYDHFPFSGLHCIHCSCGKQFTERDYGTASERWVAHTQEGRKEVAAQELPDSTITYSIGGRVCTREEWADDKPRLPESSRALLEFDLRLTEADKVWLRVLGEWSI